MRDVKLILVTLLLCVALIVGVTIYKVQKEHLDLQVLVVTKKIEEAAMQCTWDDVCTESLITLGDLISYGYLSDEVNPVTKLYYNHESYVLVSSDGYTFYEVV